MTEFLFIYSFPFHSSHPRLPSHPSTEIRRKKQLVLFQKRRIALILMEEEARKKKALEGTHTPHTHEAHEDDDLELRLAAKIERTRKEKEKEKERERERERVSVSGGVDEEAMKAVDESMSPSIPLSTSSLPLSNPPSSSSSTSSNALSLSPKLSVSGSRILFPSMDIAAAEKQREQEISNQLMAFSPLRSVSKVTPLVTLDEEEGDAKEAEQKEPKSIFIRVSMKVNIDNFDITQNLLTISSICVCVCVCLQLRCMAITLKSAGQEISKISWENAGVCLIKF